MKCILQHVLRLQLTTKTLLTLTAGFAHPEKQLPHKLRTNFNCAGILRSCYFWQLTWKQLFNVWQFCRYLIKIKILTFFYKFYCYQFTAKLKQLLSWTSFSLKDRTTKLPTSQNFNFVKIKFCYHYTNCVVIQVVVELVFFFISFGS
jgi:hypothetical protein